MVLDVVGAAEHAEAEPDRAVVGDLVRPVHLLRVFLLSVLESNFPGDSL